MLGFPIALIIAWAFEMTPEGMKRTENVSPNEHIPQWSRRKFIAFVLAVGLVAAALLGFQLWRSRGASFATAKSIAVLPFENLSADKDNAYFANGIQDEILTRLAKIGDLKVISRTSTQRYKSSPDDLPKIAQQLGVAHVLEGSVQKSGDQVRVTVQLIQATTDSHLWAETYDRKLTDIFTVESEVAEKIAGSLRARLSGAEQEAVAARPTENPEAYEAYLRGLAYWNSLTNSPQVLEKNVLYFDRTVQLDPNFGLAWASLSVVHCFIYGDFERTPQRLALAKAALDRALQLDPESGETQFALGMYRYRGLQDYTGALQAFAKSRKRAANRVEAIEFSAYANRRQGKWKEAIELHRQSLGLDPRNPILLSEAALTYRAVRQFDRARELLDRALALEPNSSNLHPAESGDRICDRPFANRRATSSAAPARRPGRIDPARATLFLDLFAAERRSARSPAQGARRAGKIAGRISDNLSRLARNRREAWGQDEAAKADLAQARDQLSTIRGRGDQAPRVLRRLILTSGILRDKAAVDRIAAEARAEIENDAMDGPGIEESLAMARAQLGETNTAIASVQHLLQTFGEASLTPAYLRFDPLWGPLRSDPRFEKLSQP